jgi:hypothetical protein
MTSTAPTRTAASTRSASRRQLQRTTKGASERSRRTRGGTRGRRWTRRPANEARRGRGARGGTAVERETRGANEAQRWTRARSGPWPDAGAMLGTGTGAGADGALAGRGRDAWGQARARRAEGRMRAGCPPRVARRCASASEIRAPCGVRVRDSGVLRELGAPRRVRRTAAERGRERERVDAKCDAGQVSDEAASQTRAGCDRARSYRPSAADTMRPCGAADKRGADATNDHETKRGARARGRGSAECFT